MTSWEVLVLHSFFFDIGRFDSHTVVNILRALAILVFEANGVARHEARW